MQLRDIAKIVHGTVYGKKTFTVRGIKPPDEANAKDLTFIFGDSHDTKAGAVVAVTRMKGKHGVVVSNPKQAMYLVLKHLSRQRLHWHVSPRAEIASDIRIPSRCAIGSFVVIDSKTTIGNGSIIGAYSYIGDNVVIGRNVRIHPHVVIYPGTRISDHVEIHSNTVIGKAGFGYIKRRRYQHIPHIGGVLIEPFVEIGGNVVIDCATIGTTVIGKGTKIDNLVHIAHNVRIGRDCIIMGQVGIAGSARIGNNVTLCGQVGVSDHVHIGDNVTVYAKSAVFKSIPDRGCYSGIPARRHHAVMRALSRLYRES